MNFALDEATFAYPNVLITLPGMCFIGDVQSIGQSALVRLLNYRAPRRLMDNEVVPFVGRPKALQGHRDGCEDNVVFNTTFSDNMVRGFTTGSILVGENTWFLTATPAYIRVINTENACVSTLAGEP